MMKDWIQSLRKSSTRYEDLKALMPAGSDQPLDWSACCERLAPLARLDETPQDPIYHAEGDVGTHTRMVVDALFQDSFFQASVPERQWVMFMAALLHDIAKPDTTRVDPDSGRISQPGHSRRGAVDARLLLWQADVPWRLREAICRIIAVHQVPFFAFDSRRGESPEYLVRKLSWGLDLRELVAVARADMAGRICVSQAEHLQDIELFAQLAMEESAWGCAAPFADAHTAVAYFRGGRVHPATPLFADAGSTVVVMSGLPAAGKNTWVDKHCAGLPVVSFDDSRRELGLAHGRNEGAVAHHATDRARSLLRDKKDFVWNATHLSDQMRSKTLSLLYRYGARVEIVHVEQSLRVLLSRNQRRDTSLSNARLIDMLTRWEPPWPGEGHAVRFVSGEV